MINNTFNFNNKKGFTLVELVVTIALMAVIVGIVTPSIYVTTAKRQRNSAEADTQQMYRSAISCISDLAALKSKPEFPWGPNSKQIALNNYIQDFETVHTGTYVNKYLPILNGDSVTNSDGYKYNSRGTYYVGYADRLVRQIYKTVVALDIEVKYLSVHTNGADYSLVVPDGCSASPRGTYVSAGNKDPYIVIQILKVYENAEKNKFHDEMIISYHNKKCPFAFKDGVFDENSAYKTNGNKPIVFKYSIRNV